MKERYGMAPVGTTLFLLYSFFGKRKHGDNPCPIQQIRAIIISHSADEIKFRVSMSAG